VPSPDALLDEWRARIAQATRERPLRLRGAGSKDFYGETLAGEILDLRDFAGIIDYEPSELVITARCGTSLAQLESALAEHGQCLAFEPPAYGRDPTLGGMIAAGLSGPRRPFAGAARDFVLGVHLLAADGELLRFGGQVMKNVAGFDVSRLLCGSLGILGILTQVSLKVLPRARTETTLCLELPAAEAVRAFNRWSGQPLPLSGAAWHDGRTWVRLSGASPAVRAACAQLGGEPVEPSAAASFWEDLRHGRLALLNEPVLWRVSVPPAAGALDLPGEPLIDWGGALRWYANVPDGARVRALAEAAGGSALCWRGPAADGRFHPLTPALAQLHRALKAKFDPRGIFNPGRLVAGL
jgi:glycolate dehydrogenase FAD-binding subunit